ncbi:hypothetical protein LXL04_028532 [Taraxacum kok-saghyz]
MASSSSSFISESAISSRLWKQHVFLSFRGEDTRNNFVGHLYTALENMGIVTYKDDQKLSLGETISPSLIEAIEQSQIAIIVFSKHYADSSWCLNELKHIMKCTKKTGLIVVPIFYDVEPSDVRKQENKFGEAFAKYESVKNINVASWRDTLVEASGNSGQDLKSGEMNESELIKDIVNKVSKMICPLTPRVNDKLIGIEARRDALISQLQIGSNCVLMIGIWGVGGSGKTTLATSVYNNISWKFDGCCCIENIQDESGKNGLVTLQNKIISGVLKQDKVWVSSTEEGKHMIKERFSGKKVLIVLDDVDQRDQLEALAGSIDWFAKGSRILVTTRNKHLLNAHKVDVQKVSLLDNYEATKLFRKCACLDDKPKEDYEQVSKEVVAYASGLPLALTVLGSFLCGRGVNEWESTLARLKNIPDEDIMGKLRISYDGLTKIEQELFLDIACFFRRKDKDSAIPELEACGLYPEIGLEVLIEKALITLSLDWPDKESFDMHDLVQEMAHHIVRGEHPNNPEKHSSVWKNEDVETICAMDATTDLDMIEAIRYDYDFEALISERDNLLQHLPPIAKNMKNLRWVLWTNNRPLLLTNSPQNKLCYVTLEHSLQKQLWEGYKHLPNLKMMKLYELRNLIMLPNFSGLPNLKRFELYKCPRLQKIHSSFGALEKLVFLSIEWCWSIKIFPSINRQKNLKTLSIQRSFGLFKLIQQKIDKVALDPHLDNSGDTQVKNRLKNLKTHLFRGGSRLFNRETHHTRLWFSLPNLIKLDLSECELTDEDIGSCEWELLHLQELDLSQNEFSRLHFSRWRLPRLKWLCVDRCYSLVELSNLSSSIAIVDATDCWLLESFGDTSNCQWLWNVSTDGGKKLDPLDGERLLKSMLQGNAIHDHFIDVDLPYQIPKGFVGSFFRGKTFTSWGDTDPNAHEFKLNLPNNWYNDFSGFLIRVVGHYDMTMDIIMKQKVGTEDWRFDKWQESDKTPEPEYGGQMRTHVGYVSFSSLRKATSLNSSYNAISFDIYGGWSSFSAELVPLKCKDDGVQTTEVATNCSEFQNEEDRYFTNSTGFKIHQDSNSYIKITWDSIDS